MDPYILLGKLISSHNLPHALLLSGADGILKKEAAINLTRHLFHQNPAEIFNGKYQACSCKSCALILSKTHPDFIHVEELPISIKMVRELKRRFAESALLASWKIAVLPDAGTMTLEAANAFLKLLEEPRGNAVFILLAKSRSSILPTIASRTLEIRFPRCDTVNDFSTSSSSEDVIGTLETGSLIRKFEVAKMYGIRNKGELLTLIDRWLMNLRQKFLEGKENVQKVKKIFRLKQIISTTNANPQLLLEELFVSYA